MLRILAFDQSLQRSGWAAIDGPPAKLGTLVSGWFASANTRSFGETLHGLLIDIAPNVVVFERPHKVIMTYAKKRPGLIKGGPSFHTPNADQLVLPWIAGMIEQAAISRDLPYELVAPSTWRAQVIGKGAGALKKPEAKMAARETCRRLGLPFRNEDEAEAILIAIWGATCETVRMAAYEASK